MSVLEHKDLSGQSVKVTVLTVSDTRTEQTDKSGRRMIEMLHESGFGLADYNIVKDEPESILKALYAAFERKDVDAVLINGGTGISTRDITVDTVQSLLEKELPGYGELFRMLSFQEIGSAAMMSRAVAGTARGKVIFVTPGSTGAVQLAMDRLILPELAHCVKELNKDKGAGS